MHQGIDPDDAIHLQGLARVPRETVHHQQVPWP
jgi:hypothetical protein